MTKKLSAFPSNVQEVLQYAVDGRLLDGPYLGSIPEQNHVNTA
jgi:hypothetical protein